MKEVKKVKELSVLNVQKLQQRILTYIFAHGQATRQELVEEIGCTLMTIGRTVTELIERGLLIVDGTVTSPAGRRKSLLKLNPSHVAAVSVDIGYGSVRVALCDMACNVLHREVLSGYSDPVVNGIPEDGMHESIARMIAAAGDTPIVGLCVGISGMVDCDTGQVLFCPNIARFKDRALGKELSDRYGLPVLLDTRARCMTMGEFFFGAGRGSENMLFCSLGTGSISSGYLTGGRLYRGAHGFSGELGHTCVRPNRPVHRCSCGGYDCLELYASLEMLSESIRQRLLDYDGYSIAKRILNGRRLTRDMLDEVIGVHDPIVDECYAQAVNDIVTVLTGAVNLLTPSMLILGGAMIQIIPDIVSDIARGIYASCLIPLRERLTIVQSELGEEAALRGGAAMLMRHYLGDMQ